MKFIKFAKLFVLGICLATVSFGQTPTPTPTVAPTPPVVGEVTISTKYANTDPLYQEIRKNLEAAKLGDQCVVVNNLILTKDKGIFLMKTGEIYLLAPVQGRTTGVVFIGDGEFSLIPPVEYEKKHLAIFTDAPEIKEEFTELVAYFTDKTLDAIKNSPNAKFTTGCANTQKAADSLKEKTNLLKRQFRYNMSSRILADYMTPKRRGFFSAFIDGKKYGKLTYQIDPLGLERVYPEQVALSSYDRKDSGIWTAFHLDSEYRNGTGNSWTDRRIYDITHHDLDVAIQGTKIIGKDTFTLTTKDPELRFFPFDLFSGLRVKNVLDENGQELNFIQEKKSEDSDFGVIFAKAPEANKPLKITVEYEGDGALLNAGGGNFFLGPRSTWYPNNPFAAFADRASFNLTLSYPKIYTMVGIGERVGEDKEEGELKTSKWTTNGVDYEVAGFNYGDFKMIKVSDPSGYDLEVYANSEMPDDMKEYQMQIEDAERNNRDATGLTIGALSTLDGMKKVLAETQNATRLYSAYFGKTPFKRIAMTQQPAGNFGQAWGSLVFMPFTAYINKTQMTQMLGVRGGTSDFWTTVGPHEVAHQWWGHTVGWTSYRDQWMSEGFSELSTSIYVQYVEKDIDKFIKYWDDQRKLIVTPSPATKGFKPYTIGPLTQGYRLNSGKAGNIYRYMIYPKGAFALHMLRMMMYDHKGNTGDAKFKIMMQDFIKANYNKPVSTNDFQKAVERNITPEMDLDKNKTMNWYFDQWIYGTDVPSYKFEYSLQGNTLTGSITQSGVSPNFIMIVPIYADFGNGWQYLASVNLAGNDTLDIGRLNLPKAPKKVAIAALHDILTEKIENIRK